MVWSFVNQFERPIIRFVVNFRRPPITNVVRDLTALGSLPVLVLVLGLFYFGGQEALARRGAIGSVVLNSLVVLLKYLFHRLPPDVSIVGHIVPYTFPSGHAANAFFVATLLGNRYPRLRVALYVVAGIVGLTRVYLGVHWPTDVVAGALLGIGAGIVVRSRLVWE